MNRRLGLALVLLLAFSAAAVEHLSPPQFKPAARALLEKANALFTSDDQKGALRAYMEAVNADPAAANLDLIERYSVPMYSMPGAAPPQRQPEQPDELQQLHAEALRQYLKLRPHDRKATAQLVPLVTLPEAALLIESDPNDPDLYAARAMVYAKHGDFDRTLDDLVKAQKLDPKNPERYYFSGVVAYESATRNPRITPAQKRTLVLEGLEWFKTAESLKPDSPEPMVYHSLLLRQQATIENDPETRKKLLAQADALRQRAMEILNQRRAAAAAGHER